MSSSRFKPGTIVLTPFPFSDLSQVKKRPALIVAEESPNSVILVFISSRKSATKNKYSISINSDELNNLKTVAYVRCGKIATVHKSIIIGKIGELSKKDLELVLKTIRNIFF